MNQHPYLRAYMAGIAVPTAFLLIAMTAFTVARYVCDVPLAIERVVVFPMAVVPNLWGLWNILYVALLSRRHMSIGLFGAALPFLLVPGAYVVTRLVGFDVPAFIHSVLPYFFPIGVAIYYLAWKYLVGSLNAIVGVA
jgi:hypothetical protein